MNSALVITSVASMVDQFFLPNLLMLQDMGYDVHVACNFEKGSTCSAEKIEELKVTLKESGITYYHIDFERNVFKLAGNKRAYDQLAQIISETEFDLIHCHSPIGGVLGRFVARKERKRS